MNKARATRTGKRNHGTAKSARSASARSWEKLLKVVEERTSAARAIMAERGDHTFTTALARRLDLPGRIPGEYTDDEAFELRDSLLGVDAVLHPKAQDLYWLSWREEELKDDLAESLRASGTIDPDAVFGALHGAVASEMVRAMPDALRAEQIRATCAVVFAAMRALVKSEGAHAAGTTKVAPESETRLRAAKAG